MASGIVKLQVHLNISADILFARLTKLKAIRKNMGLLRTRQQAHTPESIHDAMVELRHVFPNAGVREMASLLFHERDMSVAR